MGFGKAFGFSLLAFIGVNFLFVIITETISGNLNALFANIASDPLILLILFFGPIINYPFAVFSSFYNIAVTAPFDIYLLIQAIGFFVAPFLAAIIAGRTGETKGGSFGGWALTAMLSAVGIGILVFINPSTLLNLGITVTPPTAIQIFVVDILIAGAVNMVFYGCFALLFTKTEYY